MTLLLSAACALFAPAARLSAQLSFGGEPPSRLLPADGGVPTLQMPSVDLAALLSEDAVAPKGTPFRFGATLPVDFGPADAGAGVWTTLPDGNNLWRLRIASEGAYSLGLLFSRYELPPGAALWLVADDGAHWLGAYDLRNNKSDGEFAIEPLPGAALTLELLWPAGEPVRDVLRVSAVVHDYRDLYALIDGGGKGAGPGDAAGACEVDVNCAAGAPWQSQKRAVTMLIIGGSLCSGSLINNTAQDGTQYYMAASHCGGLNNAIFRFGYEKSGCGSGSAPTNKSVQGSTQLANNSSLDFRLVRITSAIPANYEPYYLGWNRTGTPPTNTLTIHHPAGDVKKISFDNNAPVKSGTQWRIVQWDLGVTEGGSSGCPLLDDQGRFLGQLCCGAAYCGYPYDDYYGRFDQAWPTLAPWLDPLGTGATTFPGYDPAGGGLPPVLNTVAPATVQAFQGGTLTLSGSGFTGATSVKVGGQTFASGAFTVVNATTITLPAPTAIALGSTSVTVANASGTSAAKTFTYVETSPPKLTAPVTTFSGQPWTWAWGAGANDIGYLIYSLSNATFPYQGSTLLLNNSILLVFPLGSTGAGSLTVTTPSGYLLINVYSQLVTFDGGGFAGASPIVGTLLVQ